MASIHFYRIFLKVNDRVSNFDFTNLIDNIWYDYQPRQRTLKNDERWYSMSAYSHPMDTNLRFFWIDKSMDSNPWTGNLGTTRRVRVGGTLYQPASCMLVPESHSLVVYQPSGSPSKNQIAEYLEAFIEPTNELEDDLSILIRPVTNDLKFEQLTNRADIKQITLSVDTSKFINARNIFTNFDTLDENTQGIIRDVEDVSRRCRETSEEDQEPTATINIKKRARKNPLNFILMGFLHDGVVNQDGAIISASVVARLPGEKEDSTVKLSKNSDLLAPFPADELITGSEAIFNIIRELFENHNFNATAFNVADLPNLTPLDGDFIEYLNEPRGVLPIDKWREINEAEEENNEAV